MLKMQSEGIWTFLQHFQTHLSGGQRSDDVATPDSFLNRLSFVAESEEDNVENKVGKLIVENKVGLLIVENKVGKLII